MIKIEIDITPASAKEALDMVPCPSGRIDWLKLLTAFKQAGGDEEDARAWSKTDPKEGNYQEPVFNSTWQSIDGEKAGVTPAMLYCKAYHCKGKMEGGKFVYYKRGGDQPGKAAIGWNDPIPVSDAPKAASVAEPPRAAQEDREKAEKVEEERRGRIDTAWYTEKENGLAREYLKGRGLSDATIDRFEPGLTEEKDGVVIVYPGENYYSIRKFNPQGKEDRYRKAHGKGGGRLFNFPALTRGAGAVFVVEGEFDAMSIEQAGGAAVAGPAGSCSSFLSAALDRAGASLTAKTFVIVPDDDKRGKDNAEKVLKMLKDRKLDAYIRPLPDDIHDANDFIQADPVKMGKWVAGAASGADPMEFEECSGVSRLKALLEEMEYRKTQPPIYAGFPAFDRLMGGCLYEKLYVLGAGASVGKTTFAMQIVDNIARQGRPCLVFSLEMSANDLVAKSISRLTHDIVERMRVEDLLRAGGELYENEDAISRAKMKLKRTEVEIADGRKHARYDEAQLAVMEQAKAEYKKFADLVYIVEGRGTLTADDIAEKTTKFKKWFGVAPVVVVDYLQAIQPKEARTIDKQKVDEALNVLWNLAHNGAHTPVILISSINRESYYTPVASESFKESGNIEYTTDTLLGMHFKAVLDCKEGEKERKNNKEIINNARRANPREIQILISKNRGQQIGDAIDFNYDPRYNVFTEVGIYKGKDFGDKLNPPKEKKRALDK